MEKIYGIPEGINDVKNSFCAGCTHGNGVKILVEALNELGLRGKAAMMTPIGCFLNASQLYEMDNVMCLHGRAAAVGIFGCGGCVLGALGPGMLGWMSANFSMRAGFASLAVSAAIGAVVILVARCVTFNTDKI